MQLNRHTNDLGSTSEYPLFDWLRFVLASIVALGHEGIVNGSISGNLSVQVFFSLSGWLIGGILLNTHPKHLPRFFFNRATRIWLPYFFSVATIYALSALREPITLRWLEFLFYDGTFTHNWFTLRPDPKLALAQMPLKGTGNGFWSIAVEEQFYLIAPLVIIFAKFGRSPITWCLMVAVLWWLFQTDFVSISLGVLASTVQRSQGNIHLRTWSVLASIATALMALAALLSATSTESLPYKIAAPLFAISIVLLCARPGRRAPFGVFLGAISYPMYLNHWMGAFIMNGLAKRVVWLSQPTIGIASYVLGVAAGTVAYVIVDRNVMLKRNKLYAPKIGVFLAIAAYTLVSIGIVGGLYLAK